MRTPGFWSMPPGWLAWSLAPLGWIYGKLTARRMGKAGIRAAVPVICIGNLTAGGTGKTPVALWLASALQRQGERPVFLTRGYGGAEKAACLVDPTIHTPGMVGDEALLLSRIAPTIRSADRAAGLALLTALDPTVLIMDDGLQNPSVMKDLAIAVIDGKVGFGNGFCIPAGPLRAPVADQIAKVDHALVVGGGEAGARAAQQLMPAGKPVSRARLVLVGTAAEALRGRAVLAFAGIGRPSKFFESLADAGIDARERRAFPDHHPYSEADLAALRHTAAAAALPLVTTAKDKVKLPATATDILAVEVAIVPEDGALLAAVEAAIARRRSVP